MWLYWSYPEASFHHFMSNILFVFQYKHIWSHVVCVYDEKERERVMSKVLTSLSLSLSCIFINDCLNITWPPFALSFIIYSEEWPVHPFRTSCCSVTTVTEAITCTAFVLPSRSHPRENGRATCVYNNSTQSEVYARCLPSLFDSVTFLLKQKKRKGKKKIKNSYNSMWFRNLKYPQLQWIMFYVHCTYVYTVYVVAFRYTPTRVCIDM